MKQFLLLGAIIALTFSACTRHYKPVFPKLYYFKPIEPLNVQYEIINEIR